MNNIVITKRKPRKEEIDFFISEIKTTPNISGYTKKEWERFKDVWIAEAEGKAVGVVVNKNFSKDWAETPILYVHEPHRFKGIGKRLFKEAIKSAKGAKKNIYYVSRNPIVIKWIKEEKMKIVPINKMPLSVFLHFLKKMLNFYRVKEFIRKIMVLKTEGPYIHGYKLFK